MVKVYAGEYSIPDLSTFPNIRGARTAVTPWGPDLTMHRYVGRSVNWKGVKGIPNLKRLAETLPKRDPKRGGLKAVVDILTRKGGLIDIATDRDTIVKGAAYGTIDGRVLAAPHRAFKIAEKWGKSVSVETAPTFVELYARITGRAVPTMIQIPI